MSATVEVATSKRETRVMGGRSDEKSLVHTRGVGAAGTATNGAPSFFAASRLGARTTGLSTRLTTAGAPKPAFEVSGTLRGERPAERSE